MATGRHTELAYMDMQALMGEPGPVVRSPLPEPMWPPPDDDPPGLVWISDDWGDPECEHEGLFELVDGQPCEVTRFTGPGLVAHWERSLRDGHLELSPALLFRSLTAAVEWAWSLTDAIVVSLYDTEPTGTYQVGDRVRRFPPAPDGLAEEWDRMYAPS